MSAPIFEVGARVRYSHEHAERVYRRMYQGRRKWREAFAYWLKTWGWGIGTIVEAHGSLIIVWDDTPNEIGIHVNDGRIERVEAPLPNERIAYIVERELLARVA